MKKVLIISELFRYRIACGADQRFYGLLKTMLEVYDVTWVANEVYGKEEPHHHFFMSHPGLVTHIAKMPKRTFTRRLINRFAGLWYMVFGKMTHTGIMHVESLKRALNKIDIEQYSFIMLYYLANTRMINYLRTRVEGNGILVIDTVDIQFQRNAKLFRARSLLYCFMRSMFLKRAQRDEKKALAKADILVAINREEKQYFIKNIKHSAVIYCPTGVEVENYTRNISKKQKVIIFTGAMSDKFNIQAVKHFKEEIFPLILQQVNDVKFVVVGSNPSLEVKDMEDNNTQVTGYVQDITEYYSIAYCLVCPYQVSYSHRGRIIEALAHGVPVVVTSQAVQGMGLEKVEGVFIRDDDKDFANEVIKFLSDNSYDQYNYQSLMRWANDNYSYGATYGKLFKKIEEFRESRRLNKSRNNGNLFL